MLTFLDELHTAGYSLLRPINEPGVNLKIQKIITYIEDYLIFIVRNHPHYVPEYRFIINSLTNIQNNVNIMTDDSLVIAIHDLDLVNDYIESILDYIHPN